MSTEIPFDPSTCPSHLSSSLDDLTSALAPLFGQDWVDTLDTLDPLERAKMDVMMAYTVVDLIWVYLKTKGIDPAKHEVSSELERVREYYTKIQKIESPETRKYKIDVPAAGRFISHSIPKSQRLGHKATAVEDEGASSSASGVARAGRDRAMEEQKVEVGFGKYNRMRFIVGDGEAERVVVPVPGGASGDLGVGEDEEMEDVDGDEEQELEEEEEEEESPEQEDADEEVDEDIGETSEEEEPIEDRSVDTLLKEVEMSLRESKRKRAEEF